MLRNDTDSNTETATKTRIKTKAEEAAEWYDPKNETLVRLITMTTQTNLCALDKSLAAIRRAPASYAAAASRVGGIAQRICLAAIEVGMCLDPKLRATYKGKS